MRITPRRSSCRKEQPSCEGTYETGTEECMLLSVWPAGGLASRWYLSTETPRAFVTSNLSSGIGHRRKLHDCRCAPRELSRRAARGAGAGNHSESNQIGLGTAGGGWSRSCGTLSV